MTNPPLRILQVHANDSRGGAAKIVSSLHESYLARGIDSKVVVNIKTTDNPRIFRIPNDCYRAPIARALIRAAKFVETSHVRGAWRLSRCIRFSGEPIRFAKTFLGIEDFEFPATRKILDFAMRPQILHLHNLHEKYFDLRALPALSKSVPTLVTMHDAWLLSGHCSHSFDCERWLTGCGNCPDLTIYPAIRADATALNWKRKKKIFSDSRLWVIAPSRWLLEKAERSILAPSILQSLVIPNGVDTSIFHPLEKELAREQLQIPQQKKLLLVSANNLRKSAWKDEQTLRVALEKLDLTADNTPLCIAIGENRAQERIGQIEIHYFSEIKEPQKLALFYQAADLYLHIAKVDTFPNMILEALACGTPVIATTVGGIPEQIKNLDSNEQQATGYLIAPGGAEELCNAIDVLLNNDLLRRELSENAWNDVTKRFSLEREVDEYLDVYDQMLGRLNG